jgi:hypothetical protein
MVWPRPLVTAVATSLLTSVAFLAPREARAQGTDEFGAYGGLENVGQFQSPQYVALEVRFGPYPPRVDEGLGGTPYSDVFGGDNRWLFGLEVDWQALRIPHFGSLGPGAGWGYTSMSADALLADGSGGRADQETSLSIMPMYLVGVLRVDLLATDMGIPLVVYGKGGLGYALWWASDGDETAETDDGVTGRGRSYGFQYALGAMFLLDVLDQGTAIEFDSVAGVNNSYVFIEWYSSQLDGFGSGDQMNVGTNTWMLGIALEI